MHPTEISVLFVKANRFLGKDAVRKEKAQIKREMQEKIIIDGPKKAPEEVKQPERRSPVARIGEDQADDKQLAQQRLQRYREQIQEEQERKYNSVLEMHQQIGVDFNSDKAQKKLRIIEELIRKVYQDQLVSKSDLAVRDQVINRIKETFYKASHKDYPIKITGEILISGFGSCHNGSWNSEKSDIDVTAVFFDSLTHNHH